MGFKIEQDKRLGWLLWAAQGLVLWLFYLRTLSPAFPANDSPETIAAGFGLGIQHPPGYPLHALLSRLAILGIPVGSAAWRVNLLSAFLGIAAAAAVAALARLLGAGRLGASLAFFAAGFWRCFWEQATEAKGGIYLLNLALCLGLLMAVIQAAQPTEKAKTWSRLLGLLAGLSLANHYLSAVLLILPAAGYLFFQRRRALGQALPWLLPGISLYLYLPLRARFEPWLDLGHPVDLNGFLWVFLRKGYTQGHLRGDWAVVGDQLMQWASHSLSFGALWVAGLGAWGLYQLKKVKPAEALLLAASYGLVFVSVVLVNRTEANVRWLADIFILPAQALLCAGAGLAAAPAFASLKESWRPAAVFALAALLPALHYGALDRSKDFCAYDYGRNLLLCLPKGSVYAAEGDYHFLPLVYPQAVMGKRPDAEVVVAPLLGDAWQQAKLLKRRPDLKPFSSREASASFAELLAGEGAPRATSSFHPLLPKGEPKGLLLNQRGLLQVAARSEEATPPLMKVLALRQDKRQPSEPLTEQLLPWYAVSLVNAGNQGLRNGRPGFASWAYQLALGIPGDLPRQGIQGNLDRAKQDIARDFGLKLARADKLAGLGQAAQALPLYRSALQAGVESAALWRNVGVLEYQMGRPQGAEKAFARALDFAPLDATLYKYQIMTLDRLGRGQESQALAVRGAAATGDGELRALLGKQTP